MKPFRLHISLASDVVISEFSPSLDGIIYEALSQKFCEYSADEINKEMKKILKFNDALGVFHASSLRFVISAEQGLIASSYARVDCTNHKLLSEMMMPNSKKGDKYIKIITAGGPYKKRLTRRQSYKASSCIFEAVGDVDSIVMLLANAFVGIGYDAFNVGCGSILNLHAELIEEDISLFEDGKVKRCLPFSPELAGLKGNIQLTPPYFNKNKCIIGLSPQRVVAIPQTQL
jgi:hypothetical protein